MGPSTKVKSDLFSIEAGFPMKEIDIEICFFNEQNLYRSWVPQHFVYRSWVSDLLRLPPTNNNVATSQESERLDSAQNVNRIQHCYLGLGGTLRADKCCEDT